MSTPVTTVRRIRSSHRDSVAHRALRGRADHACVLREHTRVVPRWQRLPVLPARVEDVTVYQQVEPTSRYVEADEIAVLNESHRSTRGRLRCDVPDAQPRRTSGKTTVGQEQHVLAETGAFDRSSDREHL